MKQRLLQFVFIILCSLSITPAIFSAEKNESLDTDELFDMSLEDLMSVEISVVSKKKESQYEAPGIVVVVPHDQIEIFGDRNLHQLLQRQPSVYTRGSYMYPNNIASFRGDLPTHLDIHNLIMFNGRPIRESGFGGVNFPVYMAFPLSGLDSVEMIRGPGSVLYGTNAFTGVINLKTRIPDHNELTISGMGGSYGYYESDITAGGRYGKLGYITSIRSSGQDGYSYKLTDGQGIFRSQSDKNQSFSGMMHLERGGFTFDAFAVDLDTFHLGALPWWSLPYHQFGVKKLFANAGYRLHLHDRADLEFNVTYNLHENTFANVTQTVGLNSSDVLGEVTLFANPVDNLNVTLGYLQEYRNNYKPDDNYYQSIPTYHFQPQSVYAQADYKIGDNIKLISGGQWNESSQGYEDTVSRYGIVFTPFKKWGVKLLRGEAFRAPFALETDVYDIPILVGNDELEPEKVTTYDAQLFYHTNKTYTAVTYFKSNIEGLVIRDASVSPASFKNGGEQEFDGVEFESKHFLTSHWHILCSAMYQNNKQSSDLNPSTAPDYMYKLGTGYKWDYGIASIFYSHYAKPPRLNSEVVVNPEPDALNLLTLNIQIDPSKWTDIPKGRSNLIFRVENTLNEEISVPEFNRGGNPNSLPDGPKTTFYAGLTVKF
ncbi:MAG: TonB-dependent receptor [Sedimentisphaerales bacterium]|nr:TonB-dependent receptor [Sedimentisphaerales bacterium]